MLKQCAESFHSLLDIQYKIILSRKNITKEICLSFDKSDFHHLVGLHKLDDLQILTARKSRTKIFDEILCGVISTDDIQKGVRYLSIEKRLYEFQNFESLLDSEQLTFRINRATFNSRINANFILTNQTENGDIYTFLKESSNGNYIAISFFPKEEFDYTARQTKYTVLYKEKINTKTNERVVLYNSQEELIQTAK